MTTQRLEKELECPICFDRFETPKVLPCQHTFCADCLINITKRGNVECPECRVVHHVPSKGFRINSTIEKRLLSSQPPNVSTDDEPSYIVNGWNLDLYYQGFPWLKRNPFRREPPKRQIPAPGKVPKLRQGNAYVASAGISRQLQPQVVSTDNLFKGQSKQIQGAGNSQQMELPVVHKPSHQVPELPAYPMDRSPRGWCVIINNKEFHVIQGDNTSKEMPARNGTDKDAGGSELERDIPEPVEADLDDREMIPNEADFILGYATVPGYVSFRNRNHGSLYIRKLCELLEKYANNYDLMSILVEVNREVGEAIAETDGGYYKQIPAPLVTLRKQLYFKPTLQKEAAATFQKSMETMDVGQKKNESKNVCSCF